MTPERFKEIEAMPRSSWGVSSPSYEDEILAELLAAYKESRDLLPDLREWVVNTRPGGKYNLGSQSRADGLLKRIDAAGGQ